MAGKTDLVAPIVDDTVVAIRKFPHHDGWGVESEEEGGDWGYASLLNTPPPDGSQRIGPSGGGGTHG